MKIVVAPDSFKGCLSAKEVAGAIASSLHGEYPDWNIVECPLADGGEGTLETLIAAIGGEIHHAVVSDPLGRPVNASFGLKGDTAIVEVAEACGLKHLSLSERNPLITSSNGLGELLLAARNGGAARFLIGLGGTATCDGGVGMLQVAGLREALAGCDIELLCDVDNPFVGPQGAARVFAPQKGASAEDVEILESRMEAHAARIHTETAIDVRNLAGAGAAGGLGGAFMAYFNAKRVSGIDRILDLVGFDQLIEGADLIITGEGQSDVQTLSGKVPLGVLRRSNGIPVVLMSGSIKDSEALAAAGFSRQLQVSPANTPLSEALRPETALTNLRRAALRLS